MAGTIFGEKSCQRVVQWRQIKSIMNDPFKQRDPYGRTVKIFSLGIGLVASTTFSFGVDSGIVLFYTRSSKNVFKKSTNNERVMLEYTDFIGSTFAMIKTREECQRLRRQMLSDAIRKVRTEVIKKYTAADQSLDRLGSAVLNKEEMAKLKAILEVAEDEDEAKGDMHLRKWVKWLRKEIRHAYRMTVVRVKSSPKKWSGVHLHGPPRHTLTASIEAFIWVFVTMLMILKMSTSISSSQTFAFDGSWYSSTLCILFALTPAPVGQPRQIISAHLWNMIIGMLIKLIPTGGAIDLMEWRLVSSGYGMPLIWKQALAVSVGVSGQAYLGILHPPATGLSFAFATNEKWSWVSPDSVKLPSLRKIVSRYLPSLTGNNVGSYWNRYRASIIICIDDQSFRKRSISPVVDRCWVGELRIENRPFSYPDRKDKSQMEKISSLSLVVKQKE